VVSLTIPLSDADGWQCSHVRSHVLLGNHGTFVKCTNKSRRTGYHGKICWIRTTRFIANEGQCFVDQSSKDNDSLSNKTTFSIEKHIILYFQMLIYM